MTTRQDCRDLDAHDPLRSLRDLFEIPRDVIYLDGNSLGVLPKSARQRVAEVVENEWGRGLILSWNDAGWIDLPRRLGDKIATLIGARPGEVVATDSTSINLYKVLSIALHVARRRSGKRTYVLSEASNFPTDLYIAQSLCAQHGMVLKLVDEAQIASAVDNHVAVVLLTHVNYRTGAMHDMASVVRVARHAGALTVWDLAHSAGAVPVDVHSAQADFAVGCGYKYLNGGPGAPAFAWVHPQHTEALAQPLAGWWGHQAPFEFLPNYRPAEGIARYLCGTPPVLSMAALECGLDSVLAAQALGGMEALRKKSLALTDLFIQLVESQCAEHGLMLVTPREHTRRGSQVCFSRSEGAYAIVQALIARGVIGDFRAGDGAAQPDILRFGFTPLYIGFEDVWNAVDHLRHELADGEWQRPEFDRRGAVT